MKITALNEDMFLWEKTIFCAENCSWRAGKYLAQLMREGKFRGWEKVFAAEEEGRVIGFCTLTRYDELPENCGYSPFIGFVFVDEDFRGQRLSGKLIDSACNYAGDIGFNAVYVCSGESGLYEKFGFEMICSSIETVYGLNEQLFVRMLN